MRDEWSDTESRAGQGDVEGDSFSINRSAQGLVGDFLGKVLVPSRTRSNLVDKSAALGARDVCVSRGSYTRP